MFISNKVMYSINKNGSAENLGLKTEFTLYEY